MNSNFQFNARNASPKQIAENIVLPDHFEQVAEFHNLVLVGPRGLGKTTIMKSLTAAGLYHLHQRDDLKERLSNIDFGYIPIYIPAETIWRGNAQAITNFIEDESVRDHILNGLFVDHCLHELVTSFLGSSYLDTEKSEHKNYPWMVAINKDEEKIICNESSHFWKLDIQQNSFIGLQLALLHRLNVYMSAVSSLPEQQPLEKALSNQKLDFLLMLKGFFNIVESVKKTTLRWSIYFDEMEIAPKRVLAQLYENLRSFDQRAVLKFSLYPYVDFYTMEQKAQLSGNGPMEGQDFHSIVLASKFANPDHSLARKIINQECNRSGISLGELQNYLNSSNAISRSSREYGSHGFERNYVNIYKASKSSGDKSYLKYMHDNGITNEDDIKSLKGENSRARILRKPAPIAEIRSYYLRKGTAREKEKGRRSSAKGFGYYHGFEQILTITEGNTRAIKFYLNDLINSYKKEESPAAAQNRAISRNVDRFRALVAAQTYSHDIILKQKISALALADKMGFNLADKLLAPEFQPEPALSYTLSKISDELEIPLVLAINSGALVVNQHSGGKRLIFELEGCRVRLSHRLAPFYKLPTITGQAIVFNEVPRESEVMTEQPDLLNWESNYD